MKKLLKWGLVALATASLAACGSTETETVQEPAQAPAAPKPEPAAKPEPVAPASKIAVPNVVGKDHQLAQDTMQAAGLYVLTEEDASGLGRMLVIDRNWTVVSQTPAAGTKVSDDATILLRSKKDGE